MIFGSVCRDYSMQANGAWGLEAMSVKSPRREWTVSVSKPQTIERRGAREEIGR